MKLNKYEKSFVRFAKKWLLPDDEITTTFEQFHKYKAYCEDTGDGDFDLIVTRWFKDDITTLQEIARFHLVDGYFRRKPKENKVEVAK